MSYEVKTRIFEGPLDLLLQLITSHQVEITDVSLTDIVTEYLAYLDHMRDFDLEVTSEFLLIAATLVQLKARHLLPGREGVDLDEELLLAGERDRLLARLLSSLTFKDVAAVFSHRFEAADRYVPRQVGLDPDIVVKPPDVPLGITLLDFTTIAARAFDVPAEPDLDHLDLELPSVDEALIDLQERIRIDASTDFESLVGHLATPNGVIAYFLALLELVRWGVIRIGQEEAFAPITVEQNPDAGEDDFSLGRESEWSS